MVDEIEWDTRDLAAFSKALRSNKDGRALKKQMESQFDSITENLRDRLYHGISTLPGVGTYPSDLAESVDFKTKLVGGKNARVNIVGEGRTARGKWREVGKLLDEGYLFHPAWGSWLTKPPPASLRQAVPVGPKVVTDALSRSEPNIRDEIRTVLTEYLDRYTDSKRFTT